MAGPLGWLRRHALVLTLGGVVAIVASLNATTLHLLNLRFAGWVQELRGRRTSPDRVVIVAIDDFSLQQADNADLSDDPLLRSLSQWPWPRKVHGTVLERLIEAGADAVGFDLLFEAPSSYGPDDDQVFADALQRQQQRVVLGTQVLSTRGPVAGMSFLDLAPSLSRLSPPLHRGLLNGEPDSDGVIRRLPGNAVPFFRRQLGTSVPDGLANALLKRVDSDANLSSSGTTLLDPYGPPRTIKTISIWDLLEPTSFESLKASGLLKEAIVLVGPTAAVFQDLHPAVFAGAEGMPGVELHATELANRLDGRSLRSISAPPGWNWVLAAVVIAVGLGAARLDRPLPRMGYLLGAAGLLTAVSAALIVWAGLQLPVVGLAAGIALTGFLSSGEATVHLQWQRRRLRRTLGRYLSPAVAAEIADQPEEADGLLGGRLVDVVVLMSDIRGFTAFTQTMTDQGRVKELVERLNRYFGEVVDAVHAEEGTVDKFIGDAVLAVFGAPLPREAPSNARAAIRAALSLQERLARLNKEWTAEGQPAWEQVVVLSYGWVVSGNIGCSNRMDYTVIGDAVNTASRLEAVAKQCNASIVMSEAVAQMLPSELCTQDLGTFQIRGQGLQRVFALRTDTDQNER